VASSNKLPDPIDLLFREEKEAPWQRLWLMMLTRNLWLIAGAIAIVMFVGSVSFDLVLLKHQETPLAIVVSNALVALLAATLVFTLLAYGREQRRRIEERMEALHEVNHHIRNALQALAFAAAALRDRKESAAINDAIVRIKWVLSEMLPRVEPTFEPFEGSARQISEHNAQRNDPDKSK
jgi:ABC-type nickel/cobalt efflux system permease component RcnA